jgi:hypothetical protein
MNKEWTMIYMNIHQNKLMIMKHLTNLGEKPFNCLAGGNWRMQIGGDALISVHHMEERLYNEVCIGISTAVTSPLYLNSTSVACITLLDNPHN